jgi:hypothetical protein
MKYQYVTIVTGKKGEKSSGKNLYNRNRIFDELRIVIR